MAQYQAPNQAPQQQLRAGVSWRSLFWLVLGAAGVGFAGYVYLIPYHKAQSALASHTNQLGAERTAAQEALGERDKVKSDLAKYVAEDKEKAAADAKKKATLAEIGEKLKAPLEELGATVSAGETALSISFPSAKAIDPNGIDVSEAGLAALKVLAGGVKGQGARVRVKARASSAPPPRELKALFHSAGEMQAVRAARVMSALEEAGLAPELVSIVGQPEKSGGGGHAARGKKGAAAPPERLDIEVEPE